MGRVIASFIAMKAEWRVLYSNLHYIIRKYDKIINDASGKENLLSLHLPPYCNPFFLTSQPHKVTEDLLFTYNRIWHRGLTPNKAENKDRISNFYWPWLLLCNVAYLDKDPRLRPHTPFRMNHCPVHEPAWFSHEALPTRQRYTLKYKKKQSGEIVKDGFWPSSKFLAHMQDHKGKGRCTDWPICWVQSLLFT